MVKSPKIITTADFFSRAKGYNIKARDIAAQSGLQESTISRWRSGRSNPQDGKFEVAKTAMESLIAKIKSGGM